MDDVDLATVLAELTARDPLFHRTELGTSRGHVEAMTAPDFWEVGASGSVYDRELVWATLERRYAADEPDDPDDPDDPDEWETDQLVLRPLGDGVFLLTYLLRQGERTTRRATVWERAAEGWRVIYHQGTPA